MLAAFSNCNAQTDYTRYPFDSTVTYRIVIVDNSELIGKPVEKNKLSITIRTLSDLKVEIKYSQIKEVQIVPDRNVKKGRYWFINPHATRYFFSPSAFNLKKGEGYYQNTFIVLNSVNYGITDNFSIGGGLELISTLLGQPVFFITPKLSFKVSHNLHAGAGAMYINIGGEGSATLAYGVATLGNTDHNLTGGIGWGIAAGEGSSSPIGTISGMTRVGRRIALVSENWLIPSFEGRGVYPVYSYGMRFFGEKLAVDLGFINNGEIAEELTIGVPWVSVTIKF